MEPNRAKASQMIKKQFHVKLLSYISKKWVWFQNPLDTKNKSIKLSRTTNKSGYKRSCILNFFKMFLFFYLTYWSSQCCFSKKCNDFRNKAGSFPDYTWHVFCWGSSIHLVQESMLYWPTIPSCPFRFKKGFSYWTPLKTRVIRTLHF